MRLLMDKLKSRGNVNMHNGFFAMPFASFKDLFSAGTIESWLHEGGRENALKMTQAYIILIYDESDGKQLFKALEKLDDNILYNIVMDKYGLKDHIYYKKWPFQQNPIEIPNERFDLEGLSSKEKEYARKLKISYGEIEDNKNDEKAKEVKIQL